MAPKKKEGTGTKKATDGKKPAKAGAKAGTKKTKSKEKAESSAVAATEGGLEREDEAPPAEVQQRAEEGEVNSNTLVEALDATNLAEPEAPPPAEEPAEEGPPAWLSIGAAGEDPWAHLKRVEEWEALEDEKAVKVVLEADDLAGSSRSLPVAVEAHVRQRCPEDARGLALVATDCEFEGFELSDWSRTVLVSIDLAGSKLSSLDSLLMNGWLWIRELKLAGNKLKGWPRGFEAMPALISLDVSYNPGLRLKDADLSPLSGLWKLSLGTNGLTSLTGVEEDEEDEDEEGDEADPDALPPAADPNGPNPLAKLAALTDIDLSENDLETPKALRHLTALPQLRILNVDGNPLEDTRNWKKEVLKILPRLAKINNDGTGKGSGEKYRGPVPYNDSGTREIFEANADRSSCSCIEGNPCAFAENCLNWRERYTIAMQARKAKGYDVGARGVQYNM